MDKNTREPAHDFRDRVVDNAFRRGLLTLGCGRCTIRFSPPLSITRGEMDEGMEIFEEAITLAEREYSIANVT